MSGMNGNGQMGLAEMLAASAYELVEVDAMPEIVAAKAEAAATPLIDHSARIAKLKAELERIKGKRSKKDWWIKAKRDARRSTLNDAAGKQRRMIARIQTFMRKKREAEMLQKDDEALNCIEEQIKALAQEMEGGRRRKATAILREPMPSKRRRKGDKPQEVMDLDEKHDSQPKKPSGPEPSSSSASAALGAQAPQKPDDDYEPSASEESESSGSDDEYASSDDSTTLKNEMKKLGKKSRRKSMRKERDPKDPMAELVSQLK
jgi:hypothetical protein